MHIERAISFNWRAVKLFMQKGENEMTRTKEEQKHNGVFPWGLCTVLFQFILIHFKVERKNRKVLVTVYLNINYQTGHFKCQTHEVIDDISSLGKALKTIGSQWSNGKREFCGPDWGSELSPCRVCRKGCISQSLKRILAFVPWFHSTKGPWSRNVNGCFCGLGTFNWVVHIYTYFWKWCLIYARGENPILSSLNELVKSLRVKRASQNLLLGIF